MKVAIYKLWREASEEVTLSTSQSLASRPVCLNNPVVYWYLVMVALTNEPKRKVTEGWEWDGVM